MHPRRLHAFHCRYGGNMVKRKRRQQAGDAVGRFCSSSPTVGASDGGEVPGNARRSSPPPSPPSGTITAGVGKANSAAAAAEASRNTARPAVGGPDGESGSDGIDEVIDLTASSTEPSAESPATRDFQKAQGHLQEMWDLHNEVAATDITISALTAVLKNLKSKKKALLHALAEAHKKASNKHKRRQLRLLT